MIYCEVSGMKQNSPSSNRKPHFLAIWKRKEIIIITILGFTVFFNMLFNGFVGDDTTQVVKNVPARSILNVVQFFKGSTFYVQALGSFAGIYYKPLMMAVYSLIYTFFGPNPLYFHLIQLIIHITNAVLVFVLLKYFFKKDIAMLLSLVFLVHPINQEAVAYISAMQDILFFGFGMSAIVILSYTKLDIVKLLIIHMLLLFSLLSKETGVLFIGLVLLYVYLFKKNLFSRIFFFVSLVLLEYSLLRFVLAGLTIQPSRLAPIGYLSFIQRLENIPKIFFFYIRTFFFPRDLAISQMWTVEKVTISDFFSPLILIGLFFVFLLLIGKMISTRRIEFKQTYLFFVFWFLLGVLFHAQIIPLDATVADRWFYFPMIGLLGIIGIPLQFVHDQRKNNILTVVVCVIVVILSIRTIVRNSDWKDKITLYSHDVMISKDSYMLENALGASLLQKTNYELAGVHIQKAILLAPNYWNSWNNLGYYYLGINKTDEAERSFRQAVTRTTYPLPYINLATLLYKEGRFTEDKEFIQESIRKIPRSPQLWVLLAIVDYELGLKDEAFYALQSSIDIVPSNLARSLQTQINSGKQLDKVYVQKILSMIDKAL